ncbi:hypothetical protein T265_10702 [Opisthorchis viverrini]|uniref:Uncharacterized protein n=1 Tax=Opisthorchis viverrini TaxID=6198 RepID=A0A075A085_OPIVI|nr:hypothetical protein T265_10702 [Opisthorchis viverrini]KER20829.1 hypothetical protein T265_10702 [Opisthorchis viverrini]
MSASQFSALFPRAYFGPQPPPHPAVITTTVSSQLIHSLCMFDHLEHWKSSNAQLPTPPPQTIGERNWQLPPLCNKYEVLTTDNDDGDWENPLLRQAGSIPALVLYSSGMAVRHRKGATAERYILRPSLLDSLTFRSSHVLSVLQSGEELRISILTMLDGFMYLPANRAITSNIGYVPPVFCGPNLLQLRPMCSWYMVYRGKDDLLVRTLGQPGSVAVLMLSSGDMAASHRKDVAAGL